MKLPIPSTRRRVWFDPRFVIGMMLVAASVGGVIFLIGTFDHSRPVFVASVTLLSGQRIDADDLDIASVSMGAAGSAYLEPASMPQAGVVVTRTIAAGELIPLSAVSSAAEAGFAAIVVELNGRVGADVVAGAVVDLWAAAPAAEGGGFGTPTVLVGAASVIRLVEDEGFMVSDRGMGVELQLPSGSVAAVLEAIAGESSLALVAVNAPLAD